MAFKCHPWTETHKEPLCGIGGEIQVCKRRRQSIDVDGNIEVAQ
ncbi:MAG: DUF2733 domain-containing protein [Fibrobacter sp.]|nr:DUF2733 domain-containing protein [Fibrobacter sp.]